MVKTILVPLDGTVPAEQALRYAIRLAQQCGSKLLLKRVAQINNLLQGEIPGPDSSESVQLSAIRAAETYLDEVKQLITAPKYQLHLDEQRVETIVNYGNTVENITELLNLEQVDLVVMTTHGRGGFSDLLVGSTAASVVHCSRVPVMMLRPDRRSNHHHNAPTLPALLEQPDDNSLEALATQPKYTIRTFAPWTRPVVSRARKS